MAAVAFRWLAIGAEPGEGAPGEGVVVVAGLLSLVGGAAYCGLAASGGLVARPGGSYPLLRSASSRRTSTATTRTMRPATGASLRPAPCRPRGFTAWSRVHWSSLL